MRRTAFWAFAALVAVGVLGTATFALAHGFGGKDAKAGDMSGYNEVPPASSVATGSLRAKIDDDAQKIDYTLTYANLEGDATQSHIHFGQEHVAGGIVVWLCGSASNPGPAGTPSCPARAGTVTGTIVPGSVAPNGQVQGIAPGEFGELVRAIRAGAAYANVHSTKFPAGEIRAQLLAGGGHGRGRH